MNDEFTNAGDVLKNLFSKLMPEEASGYTGLFSGWEKTVGSEAAMHVIPKDVVNGSLILEADHPGWTQRIRMRQEGILSEIQSRYPELGIQKLKITVGNGKKNLRQKRKHPEQEPIVEIKEHPAEITPSVVYDENPPEEDRKFLELLEKMRRHSDS